MRAADLSSPSRLVAAIDAENLSQKNISFVLSIMKSSFDGNTLNAYDEHNIKHFQFHRRDKPDEEVLSVLAESCCLIEQRLQEGKGVLVNCRMGRSRSATVVIAYGKLYQSIASLLRSGRYGALIVKLWQSCNANGLAAAKHLSL